MIEAVLFDKDGTLFDFEATWGATGAEVVRVLAAGDPALETRIGDALGFEEGAGFRADSIMIGGSTADVMAVLAPLIGARPDLAEVLDGIGTHVTQVPAPGLFEALDALTERYTLGVVTNDSEAPARSHLTQVGIARYFAFVAGYDSGFGQKPGPGQLLAFCEVVGVAPEAVLMVGDSLHDLEAARRAGMPAVGVLTGIAREAELAPHAEAVLPSVGDVPTWIAQRNAL